MISGEMKCPFCAEVIKAEAIRCKHCQADLTTGKGSQKKPPKKSLTAAEAKKKGRDFLIMVGVFVLVGVGVVGAIIYRFATDEASKKEDEEIAQRSKRRMEELRKETNEIVSRFETAQDAAPVVVPEKKPDDANDPPIMVKFLDLIADGEKYKGKRVQVRGRLEWRDTNLINKFRYLHSKCDSLPMPGGEKIAVSYQNAPADLRSKLIRFPLCARVYVVGRFGSRGFAGLSVELEQVARTRMRFKGQSLRDARPRKRNKPDARIGFLRKELKKNWCKLKRVRRMAKLGTGFLAEGTCIHTSYGSLFSFSCVCSQTGCGCKNNPL